MLNHLCVLDEQKVICHYEESAIVSVAVIYYLQCFSGSSFQFLTATTATKASRFQEIIIFFLSLIHVVCNLSFAVWHRLSVKKL